MRAVTVLLLVFLAPVVLAQSCDPAATDEVCPDTTDWHRYFPLELGNVWHYEDARLTGEPVTFSSWAITGEAEVDGQTYFEFERCEAAADGSALCEDPMLLRYDEHELILRRTGDGDVWWNDFPCGLGGAFNTGSSFDESKPCTGPAEGFVPVALQGAYGAAVIVPPDEVGGDTRKSFEMYPGTGPEMYAGLGVTKYFYDLVAEPMRLVYANVGGEQIGMPAFASCDPADAGDVPCPDTTDWRRYLPLAVGNEWQYREVFDVSDVRYWGWRITGEIEAGGHTYFELERCSEMDGGAVVCGAPRLVRYHDDYPLVVQYQEDDDTWWSGVPCGLDFHFNGFGRGEGRMCEGPGAEGYFHIGVTGAYASTPPPIGAPDDTRKTFDTPVFERISLYAGLGLVAMEDEVHSEPTRLVYARVDGVEYSTPAFDFPTSSEPGAAQPVVTGFTAAFPNPARGVMQAQYTLAAPQAVRLELIDLLGRRVREVKLGPQAAGPHDVQIDLGGLRPGLYVLRLRGDSGAEATRRVVVR